jgi:2'-hydroxyisoflavone reductase
MGEWLVLGGTRFLSYAVAAEALARGHAVVGGGGGGGGGVPPSDELVGVGPKLA